MEELFKGNPAKFPSNNTEEQNSVYKLLDMLDKTYIKPDPKIIDKFPNTDGEITITDQQQYPIGKIELQIKTLPSKDLEKPRYQCDRPFLKHCEISLLPVILIAVNAANNIAYWFHFSREALTELSSKLSGDSITLHIPKENIISYTDKGYIEEWTSIVRRYVARK